MYVDEYHFLFHQLYVLIIEKLNIHDEIMSYAPKPTAYNSLVIRFAISLFFTKKEKLYEIVSKIKTKYEIGFCNIEFLNFHNMAYITLCFTYEYLHTKFPRKIKLKNGYKICL